MSASLVAIDEFAHCRSETLGPGSDRMMLEALEPSTRIFGSPSEDPAAVYAVRRDRALLRAVPGRSNGPLPNARTVTAPVWEIDPSLDEAWRDQKRAEVGEDVFRQEYAAEFVGSGGAFFSLSGPGLCGGAGATGSRLELVRGA